MGLGFRILRSFNLCGLPFRVSIIKLKPFWPWSWGKRVAGTPVAGLGFRVCALGS